MPGSGGLDADPCDRHVIVDGNSICLECCELLQQQAVVIVATLAAVYKFSMLLTVQAVILRAFVAQPSCKQHL